MSVLSVMETMERPLAEEGSSAADAQTLVELAFATILNRSATMVVLEPYAAGYRLRVERGAESLGALRIESLTALDAIERFRGMMGLTSPRIARPVESAPITARAGEQTAVASCTITAGRSGSAVQLRTLSLDGSSARRVTLRRCSRCGAFAPATEAICDVDGALLEDVLDDPRPGGTIGAHALDEELGSGAMGTVFAATHVFLGRAAAIKVLHRCWSREPRQTRAFLAEARAASRIRHPNIVEVNDFGTLEDGRPFVVMERLSGESLATLLDEEPALPPAVALAIAREVARALHAAHSAGIVHNDLKPSNIVLLAPYADHEPRLKVIDFGAASAIEACTLHRDVVVGTPQYMSPEQVQGLSTDARSDIYALGVVLYQLLAGALPFDDGDLDVLLHAQLTKPAPTVAAPDAPLPEVVSDLVSRMLSKDPEGRPQSAAALELELTAALSLVAPKRTAS